MLRIAGSLGSLKKNCRFPWLTQKELQVPLPTLKPVKENLQGRVQLVQLFKGNHSIKTTSYVMPNHVHCILFFPDGNYDLSKIIANGKWFIAYEIIRRLEQKGCKNILMQLKEGVSEKQIEKVKS